MTGYPNVLASALGGHAMIRRKMRVEAYDCSRQCGLHCHLDHNQAPTQFTYNATKRVGQVVRLPLREHFFFGAFQSHGLARFVLFTALQFFNHVLHTQAVEATQWHGLWSAIGVPG